MAIFGYCWVASWMTHLSLLFTLPAQNHIRDTDHVFQRLSQFWQQRSIDESETRKEIGDFSLFYDGYILVSKYSRVYLDNTVAKVLILTHFSRPGKVTKTHCSKSSFYVQKINFDFLRKLSYFFGKKLVKMLWFWTFKLLTTLISREKLSIFFGVKNSWKCCDFGLFSCW